jgi:predicted MFS family arabinose efflux permease
MPFTRTGVALAALSAACFISFTSENLPVALLPVLAAGLGVSGSAIGLLMTGYALVVAVTVVPLVAATTRWDRRTAVLISIGSIAVSNLVLAIAPNYGVAVFARVISAVGHGVFWAVVAAMAARLLGPERAGRATAVVYAGNSVAFLFGLPVSSWLGNTIGWRPTVLLVGAVALLLVLVIRATVGPMPAGESTRRPGPGAIRRLAADRALLPVNAVTLILVIGHFTAFTYITAIIARSVHLTGTATSALLLVNGAAGLIGLVLVGRFADTRPRATALAVTGGLAACLLLLLAAGTSEPGLAGTAVVLWAAPAGGMAVVLQSAVLRAAPAQPDLASAVYIVAYQLGIAGGAWIGAACYGAGALPAGIAIAAACGLAAAVLAVRAAALRNRRKSRQPI